MCCLCKSHDRQSLITTPRNRMDLTGSMFVLGGGGHLCMIPHIGYQLPILETTTPIGYHFKFHISYPPNFPNLIRFEELFSKNGIFFVKNSNFLVKNGIFIVQKW